MKLRKSERGVYEPVMSEEDVLGQIRQLLELNGARVFRIIERIPWGKTSSEKGIPDLQGYVIAGDVTHHAVPFWIEVKRKGGKLRPAQASFINDYQAVGLIAFKAECWEDVKTEFGKYGIKFRTG